MVPPSFPDTLVPAPGTIYTKPGPAGPTLEKVALGWKRWAAVKRQLLSSRGRGSPTIFKSLNFHVCGTFLRSSSSGATEQTKLFLFFHIGKQQMGPPLQAQPPAPLLLPPGTQADHWTWGWLQILFAPLNCRLTLGKPFNLLSLRPYLESGESSHSPWG